MANDSVWRRISARCPWRILPLEIAKACCRYAFQAARTALWRFGYRIRLGNNCYVGKGVRFVYPENIAIGSRVTIAEGVELWSESSSGRLELHNNTQIGRRVKLDFSGGLTIGRGTLLSEEVLIYTHDHGYDPRSRPTCLPLEIGENAWLGARAIVLPSVRRIEDGAVIGAGALVTRDIGRNQVYVADSGRLLSKR